MSTTQRFQEARVASFALVVLLVAQGTLAQQVVYPRGDADCSGRLTAVDVIAAVRGAGGVSTCGNEDCNRDGVVSADDLACAVDCLFGSCPTPANAPRVTSVTAYSAPNIVPLSVVSVSVDNLGSAERLKRVTIGDSEAQIVGPPSSDILVVLVPNIAPGPAEVVVYDGDLAGFPFAISVLPALPIGVPDTFDGSLDLLHEVLVLFGSSNLEVVYGDDTDAVRGELASLRSSLGIERAQLAADPMFTPQVRAQLDATLDSSGLPEQLRQLQADLTAMQSGTAAQGGGAQIDSSLIGLTAALATAVAAVAAIAGVPLVTAASLIPALLAGIGTLVGLNATGIVEPPKILFPEFDDRDGNAVTRAVDGGLVKITGERLLFTNLVMRTARAELVLAPEASAADSLQFRIPPRTYGVCGSAEFFLRRTAPPFAESIHIRRNVLPELSEILGPVPARPGDNLQLKVRGVAGCEADARFHGDADTESARVEYLSSAVSYAAVPALAPGDYELDLAVGSQTTTPQLPIGIITPVTGLDVFCQMHSLVVAPGTPSTTTCFANPEPANVKFPIQFQTFRWSSSDTGTASLQESAPMVGTGIATVTAVAPGTTMINASLPRLKITGDLPYTITVTDITPPSVALAAPDTADPEASVAVSVTASDNVLVTRIVLHVTGDAASSDEEFPCQQLEKTCANGFTVGLKSSGQVTLVADAFDESGNKGTSNTVTITINPPAADTMPPALMITSPANSGTVNAGETVQATAQATDNQPGDSGVQRVVIDVSGDALLSPAHLDTGTLPAAVPSTTQMVPFTVKSAADLANVTNKSIVITAQAFDAAGNTASQTSTVSVLGTLDMCDGGIQANPSSGHIGDPFTITVALTGPAAAHVARVISNNPGGQYDLQPQGGGVYTVTLFYEGQGSFTLTFTALDADGHSLCSGSIGLTSLGANG